MGAARSDCRACRVAPAGPTAGGPPLADCKVSSVREPDDCRVVHWCHLGDRRTVWLNPSTRSRADQHYGRCRSLVQPPPLPLDEAQANVDGLNTLSVAGCVTGESAWTGMASMTLLPAHHPDRGSINGGPIGEAPPGLRRGLRSSPSLDAAIAVAVRPTVRTGDEPCGRQGQRHGTAASRTRSRPVHCISGGSMTLDEKLSKPYDELWTLIS